MTVESRFSVFDDGTPSDFIGSVADSFGRNTPDPCQGSFSWTLVVDTSSAKVFGMDVDTDNRPVEARRLEFGATLPGSGVDFGTAFFAGDDESWPEEGLPSPLVPEWYNVVDSQEMMSQPVGADARRGNRPTGRIPTQHSGYEASGDAFGYAVEPRARPRPVAHPPLSCQTGACIEQRSVQSLAVVHANVPSTRRNSLPPSLPVHPTRRPRMFTIPSEVCDCCPAGPSPAHYAPPVSQRPASAPLPTPQHAPTVFTLSKRAPRPSGPTPAPWVGPEPYAVAPSSRPCTDPSCRCSMSVYSRAGSSSSWASARPHPTPHAASHGYQDGRVHARPTPATHDRDQAARPAPLMPVSSPRFSLTVDEEPPSEPPPVSWKRRGSLGAYRTGRVPGLEVEVPPSRSYISSETSPTPTLSLSPSSSLSTPGLVPVTPSSIASTPSMLAVTPPSTKGSPIMSTPSPLPLSRAKGRTAPPPLAITELTSPASSHDSLSPSLTPRDGDANPTDSNPHAAVISEFFPNYQPPKENTWDELTAHFMLPVRDAAVKLDVSVTTLKRLTRKYGLDRWPFRKLRMIDQNKERLADIVADPKTLCHRLASIKPSRSPGK